MSTTAPSRHHPQAQGSLLDVFPGRTASRITDREEIDRLNAVGMPPAYERCWFCPKPNGHIQATGYDARGRKQYRYHPISAPARTIANMKGSPPSAAPCRRLRKRIEEDLQAASRPLARP